MKRVLIVPITTLIVVTPPLRGGIVYDAWNNGEPNGMNGYRNGEAGIFTDRRRLLDDFHLDGEPSLIGLRWYSVWDTPMGGRHGTGAEISFRSDAGGSPGMVIETANITGYSEVSTGRILFSREEVEHFALFDIITLLPGRYWFEAHVIGPEANFWLTADQRLNECWVNYRDDGGLQPGSDYFGVPSDISFALVAFPAPGAIALLAIGAIAGRRRR